MVVDASNEARSESARGRGAAYGFLAWLFLADPDAPFLQQLSPGSDWQPDEDASPAVRAGIQEMREYLSERAQSPLEQTRVELAVQRTRLFRGVAPGYGPPPPYETVYRCPKEGSEPEVMLQVASFYREAGASLPADYAERQDYLGLELDLMRLLCEEESRQWAAGDADAAEPWRRLQQRFLREHLLAWAPRFCERILAEPGVRFYHGVVRVLSGFLTEEAGLLLNSP